jgi:hypothetical protein
MKNVIVTCLLLFKLLNTLSAQEESARNAWIIGGNAGYYRVNYENILIVAGRELKPRTSFQNFSITPYFGKELNAKWMLGVGLTINKNEQDDLVLRDPSATELVSSTINSQSLSFYAFSRYIFNPQQRLNVFLSPSMGYTNTKQEEFYDLQSRLLPNSIRYDIALGGGLFYNFSSSLRGLVNIGAIAYHFQRSEVEQTQSMTSGSGFSSNLGLNYLRLGLEIRL